MAQTLPSCLTGSNQAESSARLRSRNLLYPQFPDIVEFCEARANEGKTVIVAALDGTFQRKVRGSPSPELELHRQAWQEARWQLRVQSIWVFSAWTRIRILHPCPVSGGLQAFGDILNLVPLAESVVKLTAVCMQCFREASYTKRLGVEKEVGATVCPARVLGRACVLHSTQSCPLSML